MYLSDLFMSNFLIQRPVKVMDATMQLASYSRDCHHHQPNLVCPKREIPVHNDDTDLRHRLIWQNFNNCSIRKVNSEYMKFKGEVSIYFILFFLVFYVAFNTVRSYQDT